MQRRVDVFGVIHGPSGDAQRKDRLVEEGGE